MHKYLVVGNWKMNLTRRGTVELLSDLKILLRDIHDQVDVVVCPPSIYLDAASQEIKLSNIMLGAQNVAQSTDQAFTGEISPSMLGEFNCKYVIIGHSERRAKLLETDAQVAAKLVLVKEAGMVPIVCVDQPGQVQAVIDIVGAGVFAGGVVAYEPIWAIGTGNAATPEHVQEVHAQIRAIVPVDVRIIYGGSVKPSNAVEIFSQPDVDGGLIGGASLVAQDFSGICHAAMGIEK